MLVLLPLAGCGKKDAPQEEDATAEQTAQEEEAATQIANPFIDCASAAEASELAGFDVTFPESVPGYTGRFYQAIKGELAQCFYGTEDNKVLIRKGVGDEDLSGDYNDYADETTVTVGDVVVTERGSDGLVYVAIWTRDGYSFAIDADEGLEPTVIEQLVAATM